MKLHEFYPEEGQNKQFQSAQFGDVLASGEQAEFHIPDYSQSNGQSLQYQNSTSAGNP